MPDVVNPTGKHRPKRRHHGEGSRPFKVDDARRQRPWRCRIRLGRDPRTGRPRDKWFSGTSAADVERQRDEYLRLLKRARTPEAAELTVAALLDDYLASKRPNVDVSTFDRYEIVVRRYLVPTVGDVPLPMLTSETIAAERDNWGKSASSVNLAHGVLREALALAVARRLIPDSPMAGVERRRKGERKDRYLEPEEAAALLAAIAGDRIENIVRVGIGLGPRRGEILGMQWADLRLDAALWTTNLQLRFIPLRDRLPGEGPYRLVPPKADHAKGRPIRLPEFVVAALRDQQQRQDGWRTASKVWAENGLVFTDEMGNPLPPNSVTRRFEMLASRAGLGHVRFHDLRHSAATLMLAMGVQERVVQDILGHASAEQTRHYMKVVRALGEDAAKRIDAGMVASMVARTG